jgi:uncharacterized protein (TIRG00374 family)
METTTTQINDIPQGRVRNSYDLLSCVISVLAIVAIVFLATYATYTTMGITSDLHTAQPFIKRYITIPTNILETLILLFVPASCIIFQIIEKRWLGLLTTIMAVIAAWFALIISIFLLNAFAASKVVYMFAVSADNLQDFTSSPVSLAVLCALLTTTDKRQRNKVVRVGWDVLFCLCVVVLILGQATVPVLFISLLYGRFFGSLMRYIVGTVPDRAQWKSLVKELVKRGYNIISIHRLYDVEQDNCLKYDDVSLSHLSPNNRLYEMVCTTPTGTKTYTVVVYDSDTQIVSWIQRIRRFFNIKGSVDTNPISMRLNIEHIALMSFAVDSANINTIELRGIDQIRDSVILIYEKPEGLLNFSSVKEYSPILLQNCWKELSKMHKIGIVNRDIYASRVLVNPITSEVCFAPFINGNLTRDSVSINIDLVQMLVMQALYAGSEQAIAAMSNSLSEEDLQNVGPMLQKIILPKQTKDLLKIRQKEGQNVLQQLRKAILSIAPKTDDQLIQISKFSPRTVLSIVITIIAVSVVVTQLNFNQVVGAISTANPIWGIFTILFGFATLLSPAFCLKIFSPTSIPMIKGVKVQIAAGFVALAAPAGIGPAAINMRYLNRKGVSNAVALATVTIIQILQFFGTIILLIVLSLFSGNLAIAERFPSGTLIIVVLIIGTLVLTLFLIPWTKRLIMKRVAPFLRQFATRITQLISEPKIFFYGLVAVIFQTLCYVMSFMCALLAFNVQISLIDIAIVYLFSTALGSIVPTPGGLGTVEAALTLGFTAIGVPAPIALSATILFRAANYWLHIPIGYIAMKSMEKANEI